MSITNVFLQIHTPLAYAYYSNPIMLQLNVFVKIGIGICLKTHMLQIHINNCQNKNILLNFTSL